MREMEKSALLRAKAEQERAAEKVRHRAAAVDTTANQREESIRRTFDKAKEELRTTLEKQKVGLRLWTTRITERIDFDDIFTRLMSMSAMGD